MSTDKLTEEQRKKTMRAVKSTGSRIEQMLQKALWRHGHRYRKNYKKVLGKPDIVFMGLKIAIFVDSEFWHGYDWENRKYDFKSGREFWWSKIEKNMVRDRKVTDELSRDGWIVLRFWGRDIEKTLEECEALVNATIERRRLEKRQ